MSELHKFDLAYGKIVAGVDEAGRGPLAGPVVAAAVVIKNPELLAGVNDSKKLSEKKREKFYEIIMENCIVGVGIADSTTIDDINILNATFKAMREAVEPVKGHFELVLVDGNHKIREADFQNECIVAGDAKSLAIAAASIVAKVTRDRMMREAAERYPQYNFDKHKGYGTALHVANIKEHGPCEIHRRTFIKNFI